MKSTRGQVIAHILCLVPFALMAAGYFSSMLTANPIQALTLRSGRTAVNLLMLSLACRPLSNIFGLTSLLRIRTTFGVYAFLYAVFHFLVFAGLDFEFNSAWIWDEIRFKPFIQIGLAALILLIPLAVTSFYKIRKKMGKSWQVLHRIVYGIAILTIIHYLMASKGDFVVPAIYGGALLLLLLFRLPPLNILKLQSNLQVFENINRFLLKT